MTIDNSRRTALVGFGALAVGTVALAAGPSRAATTEPIIPPGARELSELMDRLRRAPRRRDFKTVPMILDHPDFWDDEALKEIIAYRGTRKQVWDNTNLAGPWLNLMRNSINAQIFSFGHQGFSCRLRHARHRPPGVVRPGRCGTNTNSPRWPAASSRRTR